jgi:putative ubiquitin-RnfH superfamily antitoxin RatB of RatAB toxin-antitoxin module
MGNKLIQVEVAYAQAEQQWLFSLQVTEGSTIEAVILQSGILTLCPSIDLNRQKVGIFSKLRSLSDCVHEGDRIEIYRPLLLDPKEIRRKKANRSSK